MTAKREFDKSIIRCFFPEYFLVVTPNGLILNMEKGGLSNGPIMYPFSTSLASKLSTTFGSWKADCRLLQIWDILGKRVRPAKNSCMRPVNK